MFEDWVFDLKGKEIVFTGKIEDYDRKHDLVPMAERLGATVKADVGNNTDILVRGFSARWKFGDYGNRENQVARMQRAGHRIVIIDAEGFFGLRSCFPAPTIQPHVPKITARQPVSKGGVLGAPYRPGQFANLVQLSGHFSKDPDAVNRGLQAHSTTQDALAEHVRSIGGTPLSPMGPECNYDLAWDSQDGTHGVAEIKSLTLANEISQVRLGLGQILDYGYRLRKRGFDPRLHLVLETFPAGYTHWSGLCQSQGVSLVIAPKFQSVT